jgi:hypothetical protein
VHLVDQNLYRMNFAFTPNYIINISSFQQFSRFKWKLLNILSFQLFRPHRFHYSKKLSRFYFLKC